MRWDAESENKFQISLDVKSTAESYQVNGHDYDEKWFTCKSEAVHQVQRDHEPAD